MDTGLGEGIGYLMILTLAIGIVILISFVFTFIKNKYVSTVSFIVFSIINSRFSYLILEKIKDLNVNEAKLSFIDIIPIISFCGIIVSIALWFLKEKTFARCIAVFCFLANIIILMKI